MRKMLFLSAAALLISCDDGDLQIEEVDFDEANIQSCPGQDEPTETTFFYKIEGDEALLLNLAEGLITNQTSTPGTLASTIPMPSSLIYRLFSDDVSEAYFCDAIPPLQPTVINENLATAGDISIETRVDTLTAEIKNYAHTISITGLALENDQGEQLTDLSTLEYGIFESQQANSARLEEGPFSNYSDSEMRRCGAFPIDTILRVYNTINDEFIALDVPESEDLFENSTTDTVPRTLDLSEGEIFNYVVFDTLVDNELACTEVFEEDIRSWRLVSTEGTLVVTTTVSEPDANGSVDYTHSLTIENLILTLKDGEEDIDDLEEIPLVELGTYVTTEE